MRRVWMMIPALFVLAACAQQTVLQTTTLPEQTTTQPSITTTSIAQQTTLTLSATTLGTTTTTISIISPAELARHAAEDDCWIAYEGKVYDITDYVPKHPGGAEKITTLCGTSNEFEQAFVKKHGTSKVNVLVSSSVYKGEFRQ